MKKLIACLPALLLLLFAATPALAFGGDVDFGGGAEYTYDTYDSYDSHDTGDSAGSGSSGLSLALTGIALVIVLLVLLGRSSSNPGGPRVDAESLDLLRQKDPAFDGDTLLQAVAGWVHRFEDAWCAGDMSPCRDLMADSRFDHYQKMLGELRQKGHAPCTQDLTVETCALEKYIPGDTVEYLDVLILETKRTWVASVQNPDQILQGNPSQVYRLHYRWRLERLENDAPWRLHSVDKLHQENL